MVTAPAANSIGRSGSLSAAIACWQQRSVDASQIPYGLRRCIQLDGLERQTRWES